MIPAMFNISFVTVANPNISMATLSTSASCVFTHAAMRFLFPCCFACTLAGLIQVQDQEP